MEIHWVQTTNLIFLSVICISSIITAINIFKIAKKLRERKLLRDGIACLLDKNYNLAITKFEELASKPMPNNKGLYYKACTLAARNENNDKENAIKLMREIVDKNLGCKEYAKKYV